MTELSHVRGLTSLGVLTMISKKNFTRAIESARIVFAPVGLFGFLAYVSQMHLFFQILSFTSIAAALVGMYQYIEVSPAPSRLLDCGAKNCTWSQENFNRDNAASMQAKTVIGWENMTEAERNSPVTLSRFARVAQELKQQLALIVFGVMLLTFASTSFAADLPNAPQPQDNTYAAGFSTDNQLYMLQGWGVGMMVGGITKRPLLGAVAGFGSCALYRSIHDQEYANDKMFGQNRMEYCAIGSATSYGMMKLFHWGKR